MCKMNHKRSRCVSIIRVSDINGAGERYLYLIFYAFDVRAKKVRLFLLFKIGRAHV